MRTKVGHLLDALLVSTGLAISACGGDDGGGRTTGALTIGGVSGNELAEQQVLRRGNGAEPQSLDPHRAEGVPSGNIHRDIFEGLTIEAPNGEVIPGVAQSWEISEDGTVYTFYLRSNARWSNGDPVTAHDFIYGLRRSLDPATLSRYTFILAPILNAEAVAAGRVPSAKLGVRALDDHRLEISLNSATPYFLGVLNHSASYPVHQASITAHGDRYARPGNLVSNGAYRLEEWVVQSHIKVVRNPYYWDDESTVIDEVWYYPTEDIASELQRFRAGELDFTSTVPSKQLGWVRENLPDQLSIAPYLGSYYYGFNMTKPPFAANPVLRRALTLAIDREIITRKITGAGQISAYGWVPPVINYTGQQMSEAAWTQGEREEEAQRLYLQAGYSSENPLHVEIIYNTSEDHRRIAVGISSMWREVLGIETSLLNQEWKVFLDTRRQREETQVFRGGWIGDYNDAYTFSELMHSRSALNDSGYVSLEYDALLALASTEGNLERRAEYLQEAEALLLKDLPILPLYFYVSTSMVKPWVGGLASNIMNHHYSKNLHLLSH
ncbi:MAG: peptide ABC transporter substrate-binding protein [Gammaproteobacteria bacterium]